MGWAIAEELLNEYFDALRGDWGDVDGRSERWRWWEFRDLLNAGSTDYTALRIALAICPKGKGHWSYYCSDFGCDES